MPSRYDVETKEIEFVLKMTTNIMLLFAFILYVFSVLFPRWIPILTLIFIIAAGWLMLNTKDKIKQWKRNWSR
jgi:hypothetical protein